MKWSLAVHSMMALLSLPGMSTAGEGVLQSALEDGSTIAHNTSGTVLWQTYSGNAVAATQAAPPPQYVEHAKMGLPSYPTRFFG